MSGAPSQGRSGAATGALLVVALMLLAGCLGAGGLPRGEAIQVPVVANESGHAVLVLLESYTVGTNVTREIHSQRLEGLGPGAEGAFRPFRCWVHEEGTGLMLRVTFPGEEPERSAIVVERPAPCGATYHARVRADDTFHLERV